MSRRTIREVPPFVKAEEQTERIRKKIKDRRPGAYIVDDVLCPSCKHNRMWEQKDNVPMKCARCGRTMEKRD